MFASGSWDCTVNLWWDKSTLTYLQSLIHYNHVFSGSFRSDGMQLAVGTADGRLFFWGIGYGISISLLAGLLELWQRIVGKTLRQMFARGATLRPVVYLHMGALLCTSNYGGNVLVMDIGKRRVVYCALPQNYTYKNLSNDFNLLGKRNLKENVRLSTCLCTSARSQRFCTCCFEGVRFYSWGVQTGQQVSSFSREALQRYYGCRWSTSIVYRMLHSMQRLDSCLLYSGIVYMYKAGLLFPFGTVRRSVAYSLLLYGVDMLYSSPHFDLLLKIVSGVNYLH